MSKTRVRWVMDKMTIDVGESADLDIHVLDIGVQDEKIAFSVEGVIQEVNGDVLESLGDKSLKPVEISFIIED